MNSILCRTLLQCNRVSVMMGNESRINFKVGIHTDTKHLLKRKDGGLRTFTEKMGCSEQKD